MPDSLRCLEKSHTFKIKIYLLFVCLKKGFPISSKSVPGTTYGTNS